MNKKLIATATTGVLLLTGAAVVGLYGWRAEHQKVSALEAQLSALQLEAKRSAVVRSVSQQMETIAYEQKAISDEQRVEAQQQTQVANEARRQAEVERQNALEAEKNAVVSERRAVEASVVAEMQRKLAEHQRIQAEFSKRVADTLSYIALGRSLGSLSTVQAQSGHKELADLLAYASYLYTSRYGGDVYYPAVFQSLMEASNSKRTWRVLTAAVTDLSSDERYSSGLYTCSTYGEIMVHTLNGEELHSQCLISNNDYDFRDLQIVGPNEVLAISRTGHLVEVQNRKVTVVELPMLIHPFDMTLIDKNTLIIVGESALATYKIAERKVVNVSTLQFKAEYVSVNNNTPIVFDKNGMMHIVHDIYKLESKKVPLKGQVTAYVQLPENDAEIYGMNDGNIFIISKGKMTQLVGHQSRITRLKVIGSQLYSSSYDGTLRLWTTNNGKVEPVTLFKTNDWMTWFSSDNKNNRMWAGDNSGNLTMALISIPVMVDKVRKNLKRDFTDEEWDYFIGKNVPKESFTARRKEGE